MWQVMKNRCQNTKNIMNRPRRLAMSLLLMSAFAVGCASSRKAERTAEEVPASKPAQVIYDESFDPFSVKDPSFVVPRKHERGAPLVQSQTSLPVPGDSAALDTSWVTVPGYQLQLLQTENGQEARERLRTAILDLDTEVEIVYDAPYYKVRAGRFLNRNDAERLQALCEEKSYTNTWVVRTPVKVRAYELSDQR